MAAYDQMGWREQFSLSKELKANLRVLPTRELNSETPGELLDQPVTPIDLLFVRNTGRMPSFSGNEIENWTLTIDGEVERPQRNFWPFSPKTHGVSLGEALDLDRCHGQGFESFRY